MKLRTLKHRTMATAARHIAGAKKTAEWFRHAPWGIQTADRRRKKRDARKAAKFCGGVQWPVRGGAVLFVTPLQFNEIRRHNCIDTPEEADTKSRAMSRMLDRMRVRSVDGTAAAGTVPSLELTHRTPQDACGAGAQEIG